MNSDNMLLLELKQCETNVWDALVAGDMEADSAALHQSFLGVYASGFSPKSHHVNQLENGPTIKSFALSDLQARHLGDDHALLSYRADFTRAHRDEQETMYVSSIWQRTQNGWINIFSQDTPAAD
ncbi:DUF4440 domain-containing protein [Maritalea sp.]|uniref:DUF4440 domain-containing protein n=1 Tax=Maritalea sp. TaxID=2003361 RepID=UPI003EF8BCC7